MRGRRRNMPSAEDERSFLSWVKRKYKAVTSYSEVDGDKLLFYVGQGQWNNLKQSRLPDFSNKTEAKVVVFNLLPT